MICSQDSSLHSEENDFTKQILNVQEVKHDNEIDVSIGSHEEAHSTSPADTRRNNNVIVTSKWRRDVLTL